MPGVSDSLVDLIEERRHSPLQVGSPHPVGDPADTGVGWRFIAAAAGLLALAVAAPTGIVTLGAASAIGSPLAAGALAALLILAPAAAAVPSGLRGAQWIGAQAAVAGPEAEFALARVAVYTLLFLYALAAAPGDCLLVLAAALVGAWGMLGCVVQWPTASPLRRHAAIVLDVALFSAFLRLGADAVAGWYALYLLLIFAVGLRFGIEALIVAAVAALCGFAAVVLSTPFWRSQPALAGGLLLALAGVPVCLGGTLHALTRAGARAQRAEAERQTTLRLIADTLGGSALADGSGGPSGPIEVVGDFAALAAGTLVPPVETFELRGLLKQALMPLRGRAAENGIALRWHVDARVPNRLRGRARALFRIVAGLAEYALNAPPATTIRIAVGAAAIDRQRLRLTLRLDGSSEARQRKRGADHGAISLRLVERLIALAEGAFAVDRPDPGRIAITVTLPLAVEAEPARFAPNLGRRSVMIVTEDDVLASELAEPLAVWNADASWPRDADLALADIVRASAANRAVLIIDGREKLLSALSLAHRAASVGDNAPLVILIAQPEQIAGLNEVTEAGLDALLPAPVTETLLAHALDALPLEAAPVAAAEVNDENSPPSRPAQPSPTTIPDERVTPIAAHPRFAPDVAQILDPKVIEGLRSLSSDPEFLADLIETFGADSQQMLRRIGTAAATGDVPAFVRGVVALRRAATQLGGTQLSELLASVHEVDAAELRQRGQAQLGRIGAEVERLIAALRDLPQADRARQG